MDGLPAHAYPTAITTGLAPASTSPTPSPSTSPDGFSSTRKRASWGNNLRSDPLTTSPTSTPTIPAAPREMSEPDIQSPDFREYHPFASQRRFPSVSSVTSTYSTAHPVTSSFALITDDDEARLTRDREQGWEPERLYSSDPEATASARPRTVRYERGPSPLKKTGTAIKSVQARLRRVSLRVVNLASTGLEDQVRLGDEDEKDNLDGDGFLDLKQKLPIRGRTLGFMGEDSTVRLALFKLLVQPWTETFILALIFFNAIVLTLQAFHSSTLSEPAPPRVSGYFHTWHDFALFTLFCFFSVEAFARIAVSGFILDPAVSFSSVFNARFSSQPQADIPPSYSTPSVVSLDSSIGRQHSLNKASRSRRLSLRERLVNFFVNFKELFRLHGKETQRPSHPLHPSSSSGSFPTLYDTRPSLTGTDSYRLQNTSQISANHQRPSLLSRTDSTITLPYKLFISRSTNKTTRNVPYLRQSWSRIDFIAIVSFWICFGLAMGGIERGANHVGVFRALSVLRTARLLSITSGTTTILHSLKMARPLMTSVAYFVLFAVVFFSIIGIQIFQGSLRRTCYLRPTLGELEMPLDPQFCGAQFCGSHLDPTTMAEVPYIPVEWSTKPPPKVVKGFTCPLGQVCKEFRNPHGDIESFDTIYNAALQVVIVASANGWSPLMYSMIDSDYFISCIFFIACIIVLNFWLINLFVAVITNTFHAIRDDTKKSAFGAAAMHPAFDDKNENEGYSSSDGKLVTKTNWLKSIYLPARWCFVFLALASLTVQATRTVHSSPTHLNILDVTELVITLAFDLEIVIRLLAEFPDWRAFFQQPNNILDLVLALGSSIIQIPSIHQSRVYPWLTIFQLARFYRVVLEVPFMRPLVLSVFGNMYGLANMSLFLILVNFIAALITVQLLRGDLSGDQAVNFGSLYNAYLGVYQVGSSENWTNVMYGAAVSEQGLGQTVLVTLFIASWMLFANFVVLQLFIAVINENFNVAEESKKSAQAQDFVEGYQPRDVGFPWMRRLNPYRWIKPNPVRVHLDNLPSTLLLPIQQTLVQDYGTPRSERERTSALVLPADTTRTKTRHYHSKSLTALQKLFTGDVQGNDVPLATLWHARDDTDATAGTNTEDEATDRYLYLDLLSAVQSEEIPLEDINDALQERRAQKEDFIRAHPSYDKPFWLLPQGNPVRRFCQKLVFPANGARLFGIQPSLVWNTAFQFTLLLVVIGGIVVEGIATPLYRRQYYKDNGYQRGAWFDLASAGFAATFLLEFLIKVAADGLLFTPNAYVRSIWNVLDFFILIGLLVNTATSLVVIGGISRLTRALKAVGALRLITLIEKMRTTFESLILSGVSRILSAGVLALLYMIPYAVWGLNIFNGLAYTCNDGSVSGVSDCIGEYSNTVYGNSFGFLAPRVWDYPSPSTTFSFDSFRSSLLILFEIVSLEGWIDVMSFTTSITGPGLQPQTNASPFNAIFFLIYHLLGGVIIFTLFVSIIIGNFSSKTGAAFLTQAQREWIDLQKLIKRQKPSRRPEGRPQNLIRGWCYDRAISKHGFWSRMMTVIFIVHIFALMTQTFSTQRVFDKIRNDFFLVLTFIYIIDTIIRLVGLGWRSFRASGWNRFDSLASGGAFLTTLVVRFGSGRVGNGEFVIQQLQKLFLVSIAFKLIQRTNSLNKLFKTAVASLPVIISLLSLWIILFLFFAILYIEVFSMTKWESGEDRNRNFATMGAALVMLAFMTTGEAWNQFMHDYALEFPRCTNSSIAEPESDCGSNGWAYTLFVAWNLLSMYIFANLFTGVVVENFSYVFQSTGTKSIDREDMRAFKKVWAKFANPRTGYLERDRFVPFFASLTGIFEVRIYPVDLAVPNIVEASRNGPNSLDLGRLSDILSGIDYASIRERRKLYSRLYHEANISHRQGRGIGFTDMLILLAHHKLIVDRDALILKDLVGRTATKKIVTDLVNLDRVRSLLKMISLRRRFLAGRAKRMATRAEQQDIPAIIVDGTVATPEEISGGMPNIQRDSYRLPDAALPQPESQRFSLQPHDRPVSGDAAARVRLQRRRASDQNLLAADPGFRISREDWSVEEDPQSVVASLDKSIWGELALETWEEEEDGGR